MYEGVRIVLQVDMRAIDSDCAHTYSGAPISRGHINTSALNLISFTFMSFSSDKGLMSAITRTSNYNIKHSV